LERLSDRERVLGQVLPSSQREKKRGRVSKKKSGGGGEKQEECSQQKEKGPKLGEGEKTLN